MTENVTKKLALLGAVDLWIVKRFFAYGTVWIMLMDNLTASPCTTLRVAHKLPHEHYPH
jgi:hypothetical protein